MYTASQAAFGWQQVRNVGDVARFGSLLFQILALVQLSLVLFFALLFAAGNVAQEKDHQTLILLLMTDLRRRELVLGKLFASLLMVAVLIAASLPPFILVHFLGGVSLDQIGWALAICGATALAAGSWGALVAFWREKTFQTLAISVLGVVLTVGVVEAIVGLAGADTLAGRWIGLLDPYRALIGVLDPLAAHTGLEPARVSAVGSVVAMLVLAVVLNTVTILRLRVWNPSRSVAALTKLSEADAAAGKVAPSRRIWSNPVIWREIRTRAYGRKVFVIKLVYVALALFAAAYLARGAVSGDLVMNMISVPGFMFVGLCLLSLILINAQAVTALTTERDAKTLEALLMTDVTAREFIFGKLGGILYNTKELILIPAILVGYHVFAGGMSLENFVYVMAAFLVLVCFAAMLGLHSGLSYDKSRAAIANSLGTVFFLFIGIFIFMMLLVEARSSFFIQFQSFIVFIGVGSIALYTSLSRKNPSGALKISASVLPFLTFYAITEFLLAGTLGVCLSIVMAYGFTTLAMLVPAVSAFDVALGRTTLDQG
jgi:ABC-type transport system involved in multi-copper enzyme maturation permease subunit